MKKTNLKVEGMTCSNCALTINKYLEKEGMQEITVNPINGEVSFVNIEKVTLDKIESGIEKLGYHIVSEAAVGNVKPKFLSNNKSRFFFTLPFTLLLMMHMLHQWIELHWLTNEWIQLFLCIPVFMIGLRFFGKSALKSIMSGVPNMNVLISLGAVVSFLYSLLGMFVYDNHDYLFFETTASIITLVFFGNYLEEKTMESTQTALSALTKSQKVTANMIAFDDQHHEVILPIDNTQLKVGDLILIKSGEQVPMDCKILWGECNVSEAIITGESLPLMKSKKDILIGGSVIESGTVKAQVTATGKETVLSGILQMVQTAQAEKPPMQKFADKISAIFVPVIIGISAITFLINHFVFNVAIDQSIMRGIAVLVISCPCAMGLATPAAISVGLGRAARKGILFRNATTLESFKKIRQIVFDKTGTLTTGKFNISNYHTTIDEDSFKSIVVSLEKYSTHPIAKSIIKEWTVAKPISWDKVEEIKGLGIKATDADGIEFTIGSVNILENKIEGTSHNIYLIRNNECIGWIDVKDEIRKEAKEIINWCKSNHIKTIMLTGDLNEKAETVANLLGIDEYYAQQSPNSKMSKIEELNKLFPTAMVGDGINDAPALAKATIGISLSDASQLALQQSDVVLMNQGLLYLPLGLGLGRHTFLTIKRNLFWAFSYNIVAIPIAAIGMLTPTFSALAMGFSDVVLALISLHLFVKKVI